MFAANSRCCCLTLCLLLGLASRLAAQTSALPPDHRPAPGEIGVYGMIRNAAGGPGQMTLLLEVTAFLLPNGRTSTIDPPKPKLIYLGNGSLLRASLDVPRTVGWGDLQVGRWLSVIGRDAGSGKPLPAREVLVMAAPGADPAAPVSPPLLPPPPVTGPVVSLDPGGHTAPINAAVFTPDGGQLITASNDKVVRIWDIASGETLRSIRGEVGVGPEGMLYAAAISPDGRLLAVGGYLAGADAAQFEIRLIDLRTGQPLRLLSGHANVVHTLEFSRDGLSLVSGSGDGTVRVWDPATGQCLRVLQGHEQPVRRVAFSPDGRRIASASDDRTVRVWGIDGAQQILRGHEAEVSSVAWTADGKWIASASGDMTIRLWNAANGTLWKLLPKQGNAVSALAISPDGKWLATGLGGGVVPDFTVRIWSVPDGKLVREFTEHTNTVFSLAFSPDSRTVASSGGNAFETYLWDCATGEARRKLVGVGSVTCAVAWAPDGKRLAWGNRIEGNSVADTMPLQRTFDLTLGEPGADVTPNERWLRNVRQQGGLVLLPTEDLGGVVARGPAGEVARMVQSTHTQFDKVRSFTFAPNGDVVVASNYTLARYDAAGARACQFIGHTGEVWGVSVSADGRYLATASIDQTIAIWPMKPPGKPAIGVQLETRAGVRITGLTPGMPAAAAGILVGDVAERVDGRPVSTTEEFIEQISRKSPGQRVTLRIRRGTGSAEVPVTVGELPSPYVSPLLSIFCGADGEWVAWTPEGYYSCSPKGERIIGWQVNRGEARAADYYPAYQLRRKLYRPDVIVRLLEAGSVSEAVLLADAERAEKTDQALVAQKIEEFAPPSVEILAPADSAAVTDPQVTLRARIRDPNKRKLSAVTLLVNGRRVGDKDLVKVPEESTEWVQPATLTPGENVLTVLAVNDAGAESPPVSIRLTYRAAGTEAEKPALYMLAVGVSQYQKQEFALKFAAKDAADLAAAFRAQEGKLFRKVECKMLTDHQATKDEVLDGLDWLSKEVTQRDWAVVFVSGHGVTDNLNQYYFAPHNIDPERLKRTGVVWSDFRTTLANLPGKVFLVLDTCHAAGATGERTRGANPYNDLLREVATDEVGLITFASCMPREVSLERDEWNNGAFTKAMVEALQGKGDASKDGIVTLAELDAYVSDRVKELTGGRQHPTTHRPSSIRSTLPVALLK